MSKTKSSNTKKKPSSQGGQHSKKRTPKEVPFQMKRNLRIQKGTEASREKTQLRKQIRLLERITDSTKLEAIDQNIQAYMTILGELIEISRKKELTEQLKHFIKKYKLGSTDSEKEKITDRIEYSHEFIAGARNKIERKEIIENVELCFRLLELEISRNQKKQANLRFYIRLHELQKDYAPRRNVKQDVFFAIQKRGNKRIRISRKLERREKPRKKISTNDIWNLLDLARTILPVVRRNISKRFSKLDRREFWVLLFTKNIFAKLFSIFASLFIFVYMQSQNIIEKNVLVPLNVVKSQNISIANELPEDLTVFVSGTKDSLLNLDINRIYAEIDIRAEGEGTYIYKPLLRGVPNNIQVVRLSPKDVEVTVSPLDRKLVNIEPELIGVPHSDYYLVRYSIEPRRLWVTGPQEILSEIIALNTEPISIEDIKSNKEVRVLLNKSIHPSIDIDREREFSVFLYLRSKYLSETIDGTFWVETGFPRDGLYLNNDITVNKINFEVLEDIAADFDAYENFTFSLRTDEIESPGFYTLRVQVRPLRGVRIKSFSPSTVVLDVQSRDGNTVKESSVPSDPPASLLRNN